MSIQLNRQKAFLVKKIENYGQYYKLKFNSHEFVWWMTWVVQKSCTQRGHWCLLIRYKSGGICYLVIQASKSDSIYYSTMDISVLQVTPIRIHVPWQHLRQYSICWSTQMHSRGIRHIQFPLVDTEEQMSDQLDQVWLCNLYFTDWHDKSFWSKCKQSFNLITFALTMIHKARCALGKMAGLTLCWRT